MIDWLIIWGVTQRVGFVFKPILEDLAKDAVKDCIKDFFKTSLSNVIRDLRNKNPLNCLLYTSPSPRDWTISRMPSSA